MTHFKKKHSITGRTSEGVLSYPHLFEASAPPGTEHYKFSATLIFNPDIEAQNTFIERLKAEINELHADAPWGNAKTFAARNGYLPVKRGDDYLTDRESGGYDISESDREMYAGKVILKTSCRADINTPRVYKKVSGELTLCEPDEVYPGCLVAISYRMSWFNVAGNTGIACWLKDVLKTADGTMLGVAGGGEEAFTEFSDTVENPNLAGGGRATLPGAGTVEGATADGGLLDDTSDVPF